MSVVSEGLFGDIDPRVDQALQALQQIKDWPYDEIKDIALVRSLLAEYPYEDLARQIGRWQEWYERTTPEVKNWRARLRTWLREGRRHGVEKRENRIGAARTDPGVRQRAGAAGVGGSRSSSIAGTVADFGSRSGRLDDW